jgi:SAM-dependent methyltransferase
MTPWQLEGNAPEVYERHLVPALFAPFAERLVGLTAPQPGDRVLDVACGTGIVARLAARLGAEAVGIDSNPLMIEVAEAVDPSVEWLVADAAELPLPDASFDHVLCQAGLQFFPDRIAALREMRRVLAPGGRLAISVWRAAEHNRGWLVLAEALHRHAGPEVGAMMRAPFAFADAGELRELVRGAGFSHVAVRIEIEAVRFPSARDMLLVQEAASPLAVPMSALTSEAREALMRDFTDSMQGYADDDGVSFAQETHVVTASLPTAPAAGS